METNITAAIENSGYMLDHHLILDPSSLQLMNTTPYGLETQQDYAFKATDGTEHNCSAYMYNNDPSKMRILHIDGQYPE